MWPTEEAGRALLGIPLCECDISDEIDCGITVFSMNNPERMYGTTEARDMSVKRHG